MLITTPFHPGQTLRLTTFQIGSAMAEILTASVWNRVMVVDLHMDAAPVAFLLALQYLLVPISLWAGHRSDTVRLWGRRRTSYIWLGRGLMVLALPLLGVSVRRFEAGDMTFGWLLATLSFLLFGVGKLSSGGVYLALVRESAPPEKQGVAIGVAETILIAFFAVFGFGFGRWMETYDEIVFWEMILLVAVLAGFFWWFAVVRVEKAGVSTTNVLGRESLRQTVAKFRQIIADRRIALFFFFLGTATFFAWMQDAILEPFGGQVLGMTTQETTRFTGYWGTGTILMLLLGFAVWRRQKPEAQARKTGIGLTIMAVGLLLLGLTAFMAQAHLLMLALLIFGLGFGVYTFGGLSLMAVMSPDRDAAAYLALWSVCVLLSKGAGTAVGGALRDFFLVFFAPATGYGLIFVIAGVGLLVAVWLLRQVDVRGFARDSGRVSLSEALVASAD
ncbi:MAG: BCD family MFS transporter [Chloroflexi bacterium]|nr:BCD family MFS transporter [Chloroflexota bacterium]MBP8055407.1 BCD family MFS transporter [Chloroflexota bacterium]